MKIAFLAESMAAFHAASLEEAPLGGMETAVIRLAEALHEDGHQVTVFSNLDNPPLSKPLYLPKRSLHHLGEVDALISVREWRPCFYPLQAKKVFYWTGDSYDLQQNFGIGDRRVAAKIDKLLAVSSWHAEMLCQKSGFPKDKTYVLRNGVHMPFFKKEEIRERKRLIYSSTPYRGLKFLPFVFKALKDKHPELTLHVFSDYKVYGEQANQAYAPLIEEYNVIKQELEKIEGCFVHGNVTQEQLAKEMMRSSILAYPNTFEETSCITVMEAQAAGCAVITSKLGALPETVGDAGVLIDKAAGSQEYLQAFINELDRLLSDDTHFESLSKKAIKRAEDYCWRKIAGKFTREILNA